MPQKCLRFYSPITHRGFELELLTKRLSTILDGKSLPDIDEESCFYIVIEDQHCATHLLTDENEHLRWLLSHNVFDPKLGKESAFNKSDFIIEIGPR
jgi:hypothetical protein